MLTMIVLPEMDMHFDKKKKDGYFGADNVVYFAKFAQ